jgi:hypothetical protein
VKPLIIRIVARTAKWFSGCACGCMKAALTGFTANPLYSCLYLRLSGTMRNCLSGATCNRLSGKTFSRLSNPAAGFKYGSAAVLLFLPAIIFTCCCIFILATSQLYG